MLNKSFVIVSVNDFKLFAFGAGFIQTDFNLITIEVVNVIYCNLFNRTYLKRFMSAGWTPFKLRLIKRHNLSFKELKNKGEYLFNPIKRYFYYNRPFHFFFLPLVVFGGSISTIEETAGRVKPLLALPLAGGVV